MLLSFINAEMSHDSLASEKAHRSLMTDVHGTTQRKSLPSQIVQIHSTVMPIVEKKIYGPRVERLFRNYYSLPSFAIYLTNFNKMQPNSVDL